VHHCIEGWSIVAFGAKEDAPVFLRWGEERISRKEFPDGDHDVEGREAGSDVTASSSLNC
jgi:hypothetical protein